MDDKPKQGRPHQQGGQKHVNHSKPQTWGSKPGGGASSIGRITAPYNFVPLSKWILHPEWQAAVSHDLPFEDGLSGEIRLELTAHSPILVGREKVGDQAVKFHTLPDGRHAIPGSTLRGMIRGVLEIATFSRMGQIDDQWLAVRDLTPGAKSFYGSKITREEPRGSRIYESRSRSGWLKFEAGQWTIRPCEHARIELSDLNQAFPLQWAGEILRARELEKKKKSGEQLDSDDFRELRSLKTSIRRSAGKKYEEFLKRHGSLEIRFTPEKKAQHHHSKGNKLVYSRARDIGKGNESGCLIFTGQPGTNKHMEFVFHAAAPSTRPVPEDVFRAFRHIHENTDEWKWLRQNVRLFPYGIPVFYLEGKDITAMGLAQMFKLAYENSIHEVIAHTDKRHTQGDDQQDFVETLFGFVSGADDALKGRVSFGDAVCSDSVRPMDEVATILNAPKPTYYPNYVVQEEADKSGNLPVRIDERGNTQVLKPYTTFMEENSEIRGWKRYPVRPLGMVKPQELTKEQSGNAKIQTRLQPLPEGTCFKGKLRFHNLLPEELGALIWALTWGGDTKLRHAIGMGKPFGYGQVSISLTEEGACIIPNKPGVASPALAALRQGFEQWMERCYARDGQSATWRESPQLRNLLAMANPDIGKTQTLEHMRLDERHNAFLEMKKTGRVLQEYPTEAENI